MPDNPEHQTLLEVAAKARDDQAVADQYQGALETLYEVKRDDHVVIDELPKCRAFRRQLYELRQALAPLVTAAENRDPVPPDFSPARAQRLIPEWETARADFHKGYRAHKLYLEKLALRFVR
ncbi:MAG TPA: hypothetical protein VE914_05410 [Candidatus Angelobacter sp.]|nr:hypothetical protein [Candidatus Angelobacter sp.]